MVEPLLGGIIGCILLVTLLFLGSPVCIGLGLSGMVGLFLIEGASGAFVGISRMAIENLWSVSLLAVPFFIFMGNMVAHHGIGADLYDTVYKWLGRLPGGLAIASTVMSALFGFMCGSGLAGTATIGAVAIPEMEERGYNRRLALGTLALAGGLSAIIPPSILMILYSVQAGASMGWMFFAGIFPGLILMALMSAYIFIRVSINPRLGPPGAKFSTPEKVKSLVHLTPVIILFLVVLGGIFMGVWSPMEAGAGGTFIAFLIALGYRRVKRDTINTAALGAVKTSVMIYFLVIGANILGSMFHVSGLTNVIHQAILGLALPNWGVVIIMVVILMILGMFMDAIAMLLITIPIFVPMVLAMGYHPVWFGIIMIVACEMGMITPPVGIHLFVIQGIAPKGTTLADVALGAAPYVGIIWLLFLLMIAFPDIAMWLPSLMRGG